MTVAATSLQGAGTVAATLLVSFVSLLYRYRRNGHPFGSRKSSAWAIAVVVIMALPAALALFLPRVPPTYLGVALPAVLGVRGERLYKKDQPSEPAVWYQVVTLGVRLLLDRLEQQMEADRDVWCERQVDLLRTWDALEDAVNALFSRLRNRSYMKDRVSRLRSHRDAVQKAVMAGRQAEARGEYDAIRKAQHEAREALCAMLRLAYEVGQTADALLPMRPPEPLLRTGD